MPLSSSINIPDLYVKNPLATGLQSGLAQYQFQKQLQQQQAAAELQRQMQEQRNQMLPLQQQLLQAQTQKMQAEAQNLPLKSQMDNMLKQRAQDNKILYLGSNNPSLMNDPSFAQQFKVAQSRVSQDIIPGQEDKIQQQLPGQQLQGQQLQGQQQQNDGSDVAEQMQFIQEQKLIPADLKNQMVRSASASIMIYDLKQTLQQLKPFFGVSGSLKGAFRAFASANGISDDEAARMYNTLSKKILSTAGEVAAGMTKSRSESTIKEWENIVNPLTSKTVSYDQVMDNVKALEDVHEINSDSLLEGYPITKKHHDNFINLQKSKLNEKYKVPRGTINGNSQPQQQTAQYSQSEVQAELKRRGLL